MGRAKSLSFSSDGDHYSGMRRMDSRESSDDGDSDGRKRNRNRITLACGRCRIRKIRCDGQSPCSKCITSSTECEYLPVTKEENILAREKKALSKANRTRVMKIPLPKLSMLSTQPKTKRKGSSRKQSVVQGSSNIPYPRLDPHDSHREHVHEGQREAAPMTPASREAFVTNYLDQSYSGSSGGNVTSMSTTPAPYFDYSSSSSSLPSENDLGSGYSPALTYVSPQYRKDEEYSYDLRYEPHTSPSAYTYLTYRDRLPHLTGYHNDSDEASYSTNANEGNQCERSQLAYPTSFAADGPSGLCMYLTASSIPYAVAQPMSRSGTSFTSDLHHSTPYDWSYSSTPSPKIYQGPIDWSARPLVPFTNPTSIPQTVRMEEVCRVPL